MVRDNRHGIRKLKFQDLNRSKCVENQVHQPYAISHSTLATGPWDESQYSIAQSKFERTSTQLMCDGRFQIMKEWC